MATAVVPPIILVLLVKLLIYVFRDLGYAAGLSMLAEDLGGLIRSHRRPNPAPVNPVIQAAALLTQVPDSPEQWLRRQLTALDVELREKTEGA